MKRYKVTFDTRKQFNNNSIVVEARNEKSAWNKSIAQVWRMVVKIELLPDETITERAERMTRFDFVADWVWRNTKRERFEDYRVHRQRGKWTISFGGTKLYPPMESDMLYSTMLRSNLSHLLHQGDDYYNEALTS